LCSPENAVSALTSDGLVATLATSGGHTASMTSGCDFQQGDSYQCLTTALKCTIFELGEMDKQMDRSLNALSPNAG